jgi:formylglycine-generating enzyme required for sulfatase activity
MASQPAAQTSPTEPWRILHWRSCQLAYREPLAEGVALTLLRIPPGSFWMGAPEGEEGSSDAERPVHRVTLGDFLLGQTPVTQAQWRAVAEWEREDVKDEGEAWPEVLDPDPVAGLTKPTQFRGDHKPVVNVSLQEAMAFCQRLRLHTGKNYTLPSEAQWEYACRAGTSTPFHFGETITSELANFDASITNANGPKGEYRQQTTPVGMFPANAWGLQDMHGNVWEWCLDHWHESYEGAPEDGRLWQEGERLKGDERSEIAKLLRGGSWFDRPRLCRSAFRSGILPYNRYYYGGVRVCCLPPGSRLDP